jgi:PAS domain S-box-containing protein
MNKRVLTGPRVEAVRPEIINGSLTVLTANGLLSKDFLDKIQAAIYLCDTHGYITHYNKAAVDLWGRSPEIGKDLWCGSWKIYEPDGITPIPIDECPMAITLKTGIAVTAKEIIVEKPSGERVNVLPWPNAFFDDQGEVIGAVNLLMDVTAYKRSEQKEAHLASIVQSSDDAIISKTLDGIITSWNPAAERIFGYHGSEMIGQPIFKLIPFDRWSEEDTIQDQLRKGNKIDHYVTKRLTKNNRLIDVSLTISPIRDSTGKIIGASKIARDITAQKKEEDALRESEERTRLAVQTAKLGTWAYDARSQELTFSDECRLAYGIAVQKQVDYSTMLELIHPADLELVQECLAKAFDSSLSGDYTVEHRIVAHDSKSTRWIRVKGKTYFSESGKAEKLIGTLLDITEERKSKDDLEQTVRERTLELQKMNEQLRSSNYDLEQFAYIASHDLQEPLRKIQSFIEIIRQSEDQAVKINYFDKMTTSARRMSRLINDVLNYSRLGKKEMLFEEINLQELFKDAETDFETLIAEKHAQIKSGELPAIRGVYIQIRELFVNLIGNSLKFSSLDPQVLIAAYALSGPALSAYPSLEKGKKYVKLVFTDNGIGFEQKYANKIFMIFQRLYPMTQYPGTGIGLALCKKIVENHGGHIEAESTPGKGSIFTVILPK